MKIYKNHRNPARISRIQEEDNSSAKRIAPHSTSLRTELSSSLYVIKNKQILIVILVSLISRLIFFFSYHPIWWDSAVYLSMGKYIFSFGKVGFWEYTRPVLWPIILGFFWKLGLNAVIIGRILELFFSLGIIYLTYLIANEIFNKRTALISSLILSFTPTFFFFGYRLYTSIPSAFLSLLAIYSFIKLKDNEKINKLIFSSWVKL